MRKQITLLLVIVNVFSLSPVAHAINTPTITITPEIILQGEPFLVTIEGVGDIKNIQSLSFEGTPITPLVYSNKIIALIGVDLRKKPGTYTLTITLKTGEAITQSVTVTQREHIEAPLGIPEKLGGNTPASQTKLVNTLASENEILSRIKTGIKSFWTKSFAWPVKNPVITDPYGYTRKTGAYSIAHKGTDFRADEGTRIYAINRGVVRVVKEFKEYGKTVVVDHGLGVMSFYMHLSKIKVNTGQLVQPEQLIGLSGQTGYAEQPHLHLTIRVGGISIDPITFFKLFGKKIE